MGTHCSTEVTSQTIMKFFALVAVLCAASVPLWPCPTPWPSHLPCLMSPDMGLLQPTGVPLDELRFKHTEDHPNPTVAMTLLLPGVSTRFNPRMTSKDTINDYNFMNQPGKMELN